MPNAHPYSPKSRLAYAKLSATPTDSSWSQVYNAGNLFACLSLTTIPTEEKLSLQALGKEVFNTLEAEFFTLEEKSLTTIKEAVQKSTEHLPEHVAISLTLAFFKDTMLYLFIQGAGRIVMKRGEKLGLLLEQQEFAANELTTASGFLNNDDTIVLETKQFADDISAEQISEALRLSLPNDMAEALSLHMHERDDGGQAAIIITYQGVTPTKILDEEEETIEDAYKENVQEPPPTATKKRFSLPKFSFPTFSRFPHLPHFSLNHTKKLFLSIVVILLILLAVSIVLTKKKQETSRTSALFEATYTPALKSYDEAKGLESLNKTLSHDNFLKAEKLLKDNHDKFPKDSKEKTQIEELLQKVETELKTASDAHAVAVKEVASSDNDLFAIEKANPDGKAFTQDADNISFVTDKAIVRVTKTTGKKKEIITNNNDWSQPVGLAPYQGNLYVLDQKNGVLKYVASSGNFSKSAYFKTTPDLTTTRSIAIDSAVWILFQDGSIKKYTRGEADSFTIKGIDKPFANPTRLFTDADTTNVYVLDAGNSRIVKLAKDGTFQSQYSAPVLKQAKDFDVHEKDKKILILANDKVWEMNL